MKSVLRVIRREPLPVFAMIVSLSVGLGAGTAVFAFLDHIWLVPLPYHEADRIVRVWERPVEGERWLGVSYPHYRTLLRSSESLDSLALYSNFEFDVSNRDLTVKAGLATVTPQFLPLLGVAPQAGRWLSAEQTESPVREAVVSSRLWRRLFGGEELGGQFLQINRRAYPVVGIMPDDFAFPSSSTEIWVPQRPPSPQEADNRFFRCVAKKRRGVLNSQVVVEVGRFFDRSNVRVSVLWEDIYGNLIGPLQWLGGAIGLVLLIAVFNAATLQFARISRRWKDFGIRSALGADTFQLAGEMLIESLLLTSAGALLGFGVFSAIFTFVTQNWPEEIPGIHDFSLLAPRPLLLLGVQILASALVLGGLSLWFVRRLNVLNRLNLGHDAAPFSSFRLRLSGAIVSVQLMAATVLLICAALLTRSFIDAITVDLGYRPDGVLAALIELPEERYLEWEAQKQAIETLHERLQAVEGVATVGFSSTLPSVASSEMTIRFPSSELSPKVAWAQVNPGFFEALGLRLIEGSLLPERVTGELVLVVNDTFSKTYLGGEAIGKMVMLGPNKAYRVVGVVSDVLQDGFLGQPETSLYYHYQQPPQRSFLHDLDRLYLTLRVQNRPFNYPSTLQGVVRNLDPEIHVEWIRPMSEILAEQIAQPRFWTVLAVCLSLLALVFSTIALYALMSYYVSQRIPEMAVRMTVGATPGEIIRLSMRNAFLIIGRGLLAGVILSLVVSVLFADLLFGAASLQAVTWIIGLSLMLAAALLAAYLPTLRAAKVDPAHCLRSS